MELSDFHKMVQTVSEYLRANQKPLVNPEISKAIMPRPKLEITFWKKKVMRIESYFIAKN